MAVSILVTAIVAAYNEERHIAGCLASLLDQTYEPLEIIVADDGSTDRTAAAVQAYAAVRLVQCPHEGKARAINAAAQAARGDILLFLDADLRFDRGYVAALVAPIAAGQSVGTCHATELVANPANVWSRCLQMSQGLPLDRRLALTSSQIAEGTIVFRAVERRRFLDAGGFDDTGFLDDQTLSPKIGRADYVRAATCHHYNPERLSEVFASGTWAGKSTYYLHGARALWRYFPGLAVFDALGAASRTRMAALFPYALVYRTGVFWGLLKRATGLDKSMGR